MLNIGVIGFGRRMEAIVGKLLATGEVRLAALCDKAPFDEVREKRKKFAFPEDIRFYGDAEEMLKSERLDGVCIGTTCPFHTEYALLVAKYNLPMFLEKPVSINEEDLERLKGILHLNEQVVVSFPLRLTPIVARVKEIIDSGELGEIGQVQAYNNVPYGPNYFHAWYREESVTGGQFLQKATHDLDYINYLLGDVKPVRICAMKSKQIFKATKKAGLKCKDCPENKTCPESFYNTKPTFPLDDWYCCYAEDSTIEDSGSAIVEYENGMHAVYTQNFFAREKAAKRGARFIGYKATLEFDWYTNSITVFSHTDGGVMTYTVSPDDEAHGGGDAILARNFLGVMKGGEVSHSPLSEGILSANMCIMAKKSSEEHKFMDIV